MSASNIRSRDAYAALVVRDLILLVRRPSRIAATVLTPVVLLLFFLGGFGSVVTATAGSTAAYSASLAVGAALLIAVLASIFGSLSMIRDRASGYLQSVLVGPTRRRDVIGARVLSGAALAFGQSIPLLIAAAALTEGSSPLRVTGAAAMILLGTLGLTGCCTALAWRFDSIEGFHGVMAGVLMPAWLLSGAVFPPNASIGMLELLRAVNPLAYVHSAAQAAMSGEPFPLQAIAVLSFAAMGVAAAVAGCKGDVKR